MVAFFSWMHVLLRRELPCEETSIVAAARLRADFHLLIPADSEVLAC